MPIALTSVKLAYHGLNQNILGPISYSYPHFSRIKVIGAHFTFLNLNPHLVAIIRNSLYWQVRLVVFKLLPFAQF